MQARACVFGYVIQQHADVGSFTQLLDPPATDPSQIHTAGRDTVIATGLSDAGHPRFARNLTRNSQVGVQDELIVVIDF